MRAEDVPGLTTAEAGEVLKHLARGIPTYLRIVEIGVYLGRSLCYLAEGSAQGGCAQVYGIDPFNLPRKSKPKYSSDATYAAAMNYIGQSEAAGLITTIKGYGVTEAAKWDRGKVGLLYIDADHRFEPVLQDFNSWAPHLDRGAWVCFDDCHSDFPGVQDAVQHLWDLGRIGDVQMKTDRLAVARFVE